jgi:hypothetical protein
LLHYYEMSDNKLFERFKNCTKRLKRNKKDEKTPGNKKLVDFRFAFPVYQWEHFQYSYRK